MAEALLSRIAVGDSAAMQECIERYGGLIWSIARRQCQNATDAEDAVQETFLELWRVADRFDESKSSEKTFVAVVARRRAIDRQRSVQRRPSMDSLEHGIPVASDTEQQLQTQDEADRARKMMGDLREEERRVLELAIDFGMSQSEIASSTGLPLGTVKTNARRGLIRLRELLGAGESASMKGGQS